MKLFVGLGNPGNEHERNRHNVGFMALDQLASDHDFSPWKRKFQGLIADGKLNGQRVLLLKPQTYMNESGRSVGEASRFLKIPLEDIVVLYDEIDLASGKLKVKTGGGNAGHNGLKSLSAHIGNDYTRVRIGVDHPGDRARVANYVLSDFAKTDATWLEPLLEEISRAAHHLAKGEGSRFLSDIANALNPKDNTKGKPQKAAKTIAPKITSAPHPAGERDTKRKSAMAENLQKWLKGRGDN